MPDMQELDIDAADTISGAEGAVSIEDEVRVPEKGVLRTENLVKKYGKRTVANKVSINVTQGEIVGLLGPNGAGKTTTFYMTVGLTAAIICCHTISSGLCMIRSRKILSVLTSNFGRWGCRFISRGVGAWCW